MEYGVLRPGDKIITNIGNEFTVGEIVTERVGYEFVVPEGAHEYTYWIPVENVVSYERKDDGRV